MLRTHGLTHIALSVRDPERSFLFYRALLGVERVYSSESFVQAQTPGTWDVLVFERSNAEIGTSGGVAHFGFRLMNADDIGLAPDLIRSAGGTILSSGEFCPGEPYVFFQDPDGYTVELWYELPTPVDPQIPKTATSG